MPEIREISQDDLQIVPSTPDKQPDRPPFPLPPTIIPTTPEIKPWYIPGMDIPLPDLNRIIPAKELN